MPRIAMVGRRWHVAAAADAHKVAGVLLEHGPNVNAKDSDGETPLHVAAAAEEVAGVRTWA